MGFESINLITFSIHPLVLFVSVVIMLATFGKTLGVRYVYMKCLTILFKWVYQWNCQFSVKKYSDLDDVTEEGLGSAVMTNSQYIHQQHIHPHFKFESNTGFQLSDAIYFINSGIKAIVSDKFTQSFQPAKLSSWNLLTRNKSYCECIKWHLGVLWFLGFVLRYCILLPLRLLLILISIALLLTGSLLIVGIPKGKFKKMCLTHLDTTACRIMNMAFSAVITYHNKENRAKGGGICVANHTSPIDILILGADNYYAMAAQSLGGIWGIMQNFRADSHIWFERSNYTDRSYVAKKLQEHVSNDSKLPVLIFPEGVCVNNTSVMMFNKGSFEVGGKIYPVAIKYNQFFAGSFWNSFKFGITKHLLMIITSWAIVVDVWYLPPMMRMDNEISTDFAKRVKYMIAKCGGLINIDWDGKLKRSKPKPQMIKKQRAVYCSSKGLKDE